MNEIVRNPLNPRIHIDPRKLRILKDSIEEVGVLVPITVFQRSKDGQYCLIDGERRWTCARQLRHPTIQAVVIPEPKPEANLLRMFSIHHLREQWSLFNTALKLEQLMDMMKTEDSRQLSTLTGMSTMKIDHCKRLLSYPKKYQDMLLLAEKKQRVRPDFFIELYPVIGNIDRVFPGFFKKYPKDLIIDNLLKKFNNGTVSAAREFRILRRMINDVETGKLPRETSKRFFVRFVEEPNTTIVGLTRELSLQFESGSEETANTCEKLSKSLSTITVKAVTENNRLGQSLQNLKKEIDRLLQENTT